MEELSMRAEGRSFSSGRTDWSAIWAGLFTFVGIWSVFGLLGLAAFPVKGDPDAKVGIGIWLVMLTAIAMFIAGRQTGSSARLSARNDGVRHGMIMFGLSLTAAIVLLMSGSVLLADFPAVNSSARSSDLVSVFTSSDWVPFATLSFGWVGAIIGVSFAGLLPLFERPQANISEHLDGRSAISSRRPHLRDVGTFFCQGTHLFLVSLVRQRLPLRELGSR